MTVDIHADNLGSWLAGNVPGFAGPFSIEKFPGGQSNPTYKIDAGSGAYVLRRKPFGTLLQSAHAVEREFQLLSAIAPIGFPVPGPIALCTDLGVIGGIFYVMDMVGGVTYWNGALPQLCGADRRRLYLAMTEVLAELHNIDVRAVGLQDFGKSGNYVERQVKRWTQQYRDSQTGMIGEMEKLIAWLPQTLPSQDRVAIIHGDFRIDNLIFAPDHSVLALIDWELSTLGDPIADFCYHALQWVLPHDGGAALGGLDLTALDIPELDEIVAQYCVAVGRETMPDLNWYFAFNLFRIAGIVQGIRKRLADGTASHAYAYETAAKVEYFARTAWQFALRCKVG